MDGVRRLRTAAFGATSWKATLSRWAEEEEAVEEEEEGGEEGGED